MTVNITIDSFTYSAENNGDCYIVDRKADIRIPDEIFDVVIIADDPAYNREYHNAELIEPYSIDGRYWFAFRELSPDELYRRELDEERDMTLDLFADQEYRLCLIELGII